MPGHERHPHSRELVETPTGSPTSDTADVTSSPSSSDESDEPSSSWSSLQCQLFRDGDGSGVESTDTDPQARRETTAVYTPKLTGVKEKTHYFLKRGYKSHYGRVVEYTNAHGFVHTFCQHQKRQEKPDVYVLEKALMSLSALLGDLQTTLELFQYGLDYDYPSYYFASIIAKLANFVELTVHVMQIAYSRLLECDISSKDESMIAVHARVFNAFARYLEGVTAFLAAADSGDLADDSMTAQFALLDKQNRQCSHRLDAVTREQKQREARARIAFERRCEAAAKLLRTMR